MPPWFGTFLSVVRFIISSHSARCFTVKLPAYVPFNVIPEFFRALAMMTRLETLQILSIPYECIKYLNREIAKNFNRFSSVTTLVIPADMVALLGGFPNVKRLWLSGHGPGDIVMSFIEKWMGAINLEILYFGEFVKANQNSLPSKCLAPFYSPVDTLKGSSLRVPTCSGYLSSFQMSSRYAFLTLRGVYI